MDGTVRPGVPVVVQPNPPSPRHSPNPLCSVTPCQGLPDYTENNRPKPRTPTPDKDPQTTDHGRDPSVSRFFNRTAHLHYVFHHRPLTLRPPPPFTPRSHQPNVFFPLEGHPGNDRDPKRSGPFPSEIDHPGVYVLVVPMSFILYQLC